MNRDKFFNRFMVLMAIILLAVPALTHAEELNCQTAKQKVLDAVALYAARGDASFPEFQDPDRGFLFGEKVKTKSGDNTYSGFIFILDENNRMLMHANNPNLNGVDFTGKKDKRGQLFVEEMIKVAKLNPSGDWHEYYWPIVAGGRPHQKTSFMHTAKHNNKTVIIGCGIFDVSPEECQWDK